jgi:hypothetical protein
VRSPSFDAGWAEVLFHSVLFSDRESFREHDDVVKHLQNALNALGAIERRNVLLRSSPHNNRVLRSSVSKLQSVADIVELESRTMDWRLRMLVLTDYIREERLPQRGWNGEEVSRNRRRPHIRVLTQTAISECQIGSAHGSIGDRPECRRSPPCQRQRGALGISESGVAIQPLWHDAAYSRLECGSGENGFLLELGTRLLSEGHINVLVGTAALLGEGWDAPAVNALLMATVVGSFVSSNQIRGRAISRRIHKTHSRRPRFGTLACVQPEEVSEEAE